MYSFVFLCFFCVFLCTVCYVVCCDVMYVHSRACLVTRVCLILRRLVTVLPLHEQLTVAHPHIDR